MIWKSQKYCLVKRKYKPVNPNCKQMHQKILLLIIAALFCINVGWGLLMNATSDSRTAKISPRRFEG